MKGLKTTIILVIVAICVVVGINRGIEAKETELSNVVTDEGTIHDIGSARSISHSKTTYGDVIFDRKVAEDDVKLVMVEYDRESVTISDDWEIRPSKEHEDYMKLYINGTECEDTESIFENSKNPGTTIYVLKGWVETNCE